MMNYIEIIGPQGVGKTTLLKKLIAEREKGSQWCTFDEAVIEIAQNLRWRDLKNARTKSLYILNKLDVLNSKTLGISNVLVKGNRGEENLEIKKKYEFLIDAQIKALADFEINISPVNLFHIMAWNYKALERSFLLEEFNYSKTVVMDEGPFKTHYGLNKVNLEKVTPESLPNAVIYVKINTNLNIDRIRARYKKTNRLSRIHNELNEDNIDTVTVKLHKILESNLCVIKTLDIPVLEIDLSGIIDEHCTKKVGEFIEEYSK